MDSRYARNILANCAIPRGEDFDVLSSAKVNSPLMWADRVKYRAPRQANGSRGRYFHNMLQRWAAKED